MILTCPECATRYQTDAAKFPPQGRNVRCAKCGHVWHQAAPQPEVEEEAISAVPPPAPEAPVYERPETPAASHYEQAQTGPFAPMVPPSDKPDVLPGIISRLGLALGWVAFIAVILVIGWAGMTYRQQIAAAWPQSASLYAGLGLPVNTRGIDIRNVVDSLETEDGQPVLVITGDLVNLGDEPVTVPAKIRIGLSDEEKREIYSYSFTPDVKTLEAGQTAAFRTRLANPPAARRNLEVRFLRAGE
jgi:predicted Zn finger-like uncharacterized protein